MTNKPVRKQNMSGNTNVWIFLYGGGLLLLFSVLIGRVYYLQFIDQVKYEEERSEQTQVVKTKKAPRGDIYDEEGRLLVTSQLRMSVFADPGLVENPDETAERLSSILEVQQAPLLEKLQREKDRFVWVKRKITPSAAERIRQEDLKGVRFRREYDRRYPHGSLASHVLGVVGADRKGLSGIELEFNDRLTGNPARVRYVRDGTGRLMFRSAENGQTLSAPGAPLKLTINLALQQIVEQELDQVTEEYSPNWASVVVLHPSTGAVKAMANRPTFDPSSYRDTEKAERRNRAITDPVEPGSSLKPFIMAAGIEEGIVTPETRIFCEDGRWRYKGRVLHDYKSFGELTATGVIEQSSNIGMAKIGIRLGSQLRPWVKRFRFGEKTNIQLPGEDPGRVQSTSEWNSIYTQTSVPMGHEILTTPLQVTNSFCVFANGGHLVRPHILHKIGDRKVQLDGRGSRVLRPSTVQDIKKMLRAVVTDGTGTPAQSDLFAIAGKTGTSKKYGDKNKYLSVFIAFAPAEDPQLVVGGFVDEPEGGYGGGKVVGPMVRRIFERASQFRNMHVNRTNSSENTW